MRIGEIHLLGPLIFTNHHESKAAAEFISEDSCELVGVSSDLLKR